MQHNLHYFFPLYFCAIVILLLKINNILQYSEYNKTIKKFLEKSFPQYIALHK